MLENKEKQLQNTLEGQVIAKKEEVNQQTRKIRDMEQENAEDERIINILGREIKQLKDENERIKQEIEQLSKMKRSEMDTCKKNKKLIDAEHKQYKKEEHTNAGIIDLNKELATKIEGTEKLL